MKKNKLITALTVTFIACSFYSCNSTKKNDKVTVRLDPSFVTNLLAGKNGGVSGADGCISIDLGNKESLFLWGDSFLGETKNNTRDTTCQIVLGNVFTTYKNDVASTFHGGTAEHPVPLLKGDSVDGHPSVMWPSHGFVKNNILHVMFSDIVTYGKGTWDFYWNAAVYYRLSLPDFKVIDKTVLTAKQVDNIHYGFGFVPVGDYMYFYGSRNNKTTKKADLYAARAKIVADKLANYEFFGNGTWSTDATKATALKGVDISMSEQFSVFENDGHYFLIAQDKAMLSNKIYSFVSDNPIGPWINKKLIYSAPESVKDTTLFTYNAMAHPQYIKNGEVLISYCVNTKHIPDLFTNVSIYKPRFFWVKLSDLLN